jgi:hypothetical protein
MLCVRLLRHVARHVALLVVDYFASRRLVVDYFAYAMCPGASARRAARLAARRRLLRLHCATWCLGTSRGSSHGSVNTKNWYRKESDPWAEFGRRIPFDKMFSSKHSVKTSVVRSVSSFGRRTVSRLEEKAFRNT